MCKVISNCVKLFRILIIQLLMDHPVQQHFILIWINHYEMRCYFMNIINNMCYLLILCINPYLFRIKTLLSQCNICYVDYSRKGLVYCKCDLFLKHFEKFSFFNYLLFYISLKYCNKIWKIWAHTLSNFCYEQISCPW